MPPTVMAGGDHRVHAVADRLERVTHGPDNRHHEDAALVSVRNDAGRAAETGDEHRNTLFQHDLDHPLHRIGIFDDIRSLGSHRREEDVHPEGLAGEASHLVNLLDQLAGNHIRPRADHAESASLRYRGGEFGMRHPSHSRLKDRVLDTEALADGCSQT